MAKEDYREKVEEHRQEIDLHNESGGKMSRASRHRKKGAKKQRNPLMTLLVIIFIFIPLGILGYVLFIFEPSLDTNTSVTKEDEKDQLVEIEKQDPSKLKIVEYDDEKANEDVNAKVQAEKEKLAAEEAKKAEQAKAAEEKKVKEAEKAQKVAAQKAKEQEQEQMKKTEEDNKAQQQTHTVQSTDNLYRIAIKYYGDGSQASIEKIKKANNLTSDSISTGQVLIINP